MLYIIGDGGHAKVIAEAADLIEKRFCYISQNTDFPEQSISEFEWLELAAREALDLGFGIICGIGTVGDTSKKRSILAKYLPWNNNFSTIIHPNAGVSPRSKLGLGVYVAQGAQIVGGATIGDHALINTGAVVDHDCKVGEGTHIACGAILCGGVTCEDWVHVGAGAVIVQGRKIASGVVIGAGTVVTKDILEPGTTWVGTPARRLINKL